jgi:voltage-gated potassium channel
MNGSQPERRAASESSKANLIPPQRRFTAMELLIALSILIIAFPFIEKLDTGNFIISILFTLVMVAAVLAVARRRMILVIAAALAVPTLLFRWLNQYWPALIPAELFLISGIAFILFVIINLLRFILRASSVTGDVLCTAISTYLMLGLLWTLAYWLVAELVPNAFAFNVASVSDTSMQGFNSLYFSFVTLGTVGYGDISPVASSVRMLAVAEAITGLIYMSVLIARLVALYTTPRSNEN